MRPHTSRLVQLHIVRKSLLLPVLMCSVSCLSHEKRDRIRGWDGTPEIVNDLGQLRWVNLDSFSQRTCLSADVRALDSARVAGATVTSIAEVDQTLYVGTDEGLLSVADVQPAVVRRIGGLPYDLVTDIEPWRDGMAVATVDWRLIGPCASCPFDDEKCNAVQRRLQNGGLGSISFVTAQGIQRSLAVSFPFDLASGADGVLWVASLGAVYSTRASIEESHVLTYPSEKISELGRQGFEGGLGSMPLWFYHVVPTASSTLLFMTWRTDGTPFFDLYATPGSGRRPRIPETPGCTLNGSVDFPFEEKEVIILHDQIASVFQEKPFTPRPPGRNGWEKIAFSTASESAVGLNGEAWFGGDVSNSTLGVAQLTKFDADGSWTFYSLPPPFDSRVTSVTACPSDRVIISQDARSGGTLRMIDFQSREIVDYTSCLGLSGHPYIVKPSSRGGIWLVQDKDPRLLHADPPGCR